MTSTFTAQITDKTHRLYIDKNVWKKEKLEVGDYVEVTIKKAKEAE